jgi:hypothetical protein
MSFFYDLNKKLNGIRELPETTHRQLNESKPDFLDLDKDGNKKEPMKQAAKQKPDYKSKMQDKFGGSAADLTKGLSIKSKKVDEAGMSRAAKGYEKYGKQGMQALAKAGREGKALDPVRNKYDKYDESMEEGNYGKDAMELNPDFAKVGRKPGVMGKIAQGVKKVADFVAPGDEDLMRDLERKSGGRRPTKEAAAPIDYDKVLDAIAALYGDDIWENDAMQDLANDLEQAGPTDRELDFIIAKGKLPKRLANTQFSAGDNVRFGEGAAPGAAPMSAKQKSFAALAEPKNKITFADKIAGAKKEVDEMLGDVAAEAMKAALGKGKQPVRGMGEATKEIPGGRRHTSEPGGYGRKDDEDAPKVQTQRGRGRPKKNADSETGQVMKPDFSAFGVTGKDVKLPKHKGAVTKHKMVGEAVSEDDIEVLERLMDEAFAEGNKALGNALQDALERIQGDDDEQVNEKAVSKKQQRFMGMVSAAKKGEKPASKEVAKVAKTMKKGDAEDFAKTKHKGLPEKAEESDKSDKKPAKEEKVEETTTSGSVATAPAAGGKKSSGGFNFGGGIYDSMNRDLENMIAESMTRLDESMNISMNMNSDSHGGPTKSLTITATEDDADKLAMMLKMAGMGSDHSHGQAYSQAPDMVDENKPDWPTNTETSDDAFQYSGGLNKPKRDVAGDGQATGQVTAVSSVDHDDEHDDKLSEASDSDMADRVRDLVGDFDRNMTQMRVYGDPDVDRAIAYLKQGDAESAVAAVVDTYGTQDGGEFRNMSDYAQDLLGDFESLIGSGQDDLDRMMEMAGVKKAKPDYIDIDKDGDKKESMKKAVDDKKETEVKESIFDLQRLWKAYKG